MTNDELLSRYLLSRQLWWQHTLAQLDAQAVADVIKTLEAVQRDLRKRLSHDAEGLAQVTDWTRERMQQVEAWTDEVLEDLSLYLDDKEVNGDTEKVLMI